MRESATTMADLGHAPGQAMAEAIADLQALIGGLGLKLDTDEPLETLVSQVSRALK